MISIFNKRAINRRALKILNYLLMGGQPIVFVGSPRGISVPSFKHLLVQTGHCLAHSFYFAKISYAQKSEKIPSLNDIPVKPAAFVVLEESHSKEFFFAFLDYAKERQIPVIGFLTAHFAHLDYRFVFNIEASSKDSWFLCWLLCQVLKRAYRYL